MVDDQAINLQTPVDAPHFAPPIGEESFVKERDQWFEDCNNERSYRYQAYWHNGGAIFISYIFMEAFNIYPIAEHERFYILLRIDLWEPRESSII